MPLDPDAARVLEQLRQQYASSGDESAVPDLAQIRAGYEQVRYLSGNAPDVPVTDVDVPAIQGAPSVPVRVYRPGVAGDSLPVVVLLHSGWFTIGSTAILDVPARLIASATPCVVVTAGYRLAPEHPFPAGLEDAVSVLRWALGHAREIGGDPDRVLVAGESAGGTLAAGAALRARDEQLPLRGQVLVYPNADSTLDTASWDAYDGYVIDRGSGRAFLDGYTTAAHAHDPYAYPLHADLVGVAPAAVLTMEYDPLRDEGEALAERLRAAGALAFSRRYDGLMHGALLMRGAIPATQAVFDDVTEQIRALTVAQADHRRRESARAEVSRP